MKKYPIYLDVHVRPYIEGSLRYDNPFSKERYEVFLIIHEKDYKLGFGSEVEEYIRDIGSYMNVEVIGLYNEVVNDEEWEEMTK